MRHTSIWTATCVTGGLLLTGCATSQHCCNHGSCQDHATVKLSKPAPEPVKQAKPEKPDKAEKPPQEYLPAGHEVVTAEPPSAEAAVPPAPAAAIRTAAKPGNDKSLTINMAHASDYRWLSGELWYTEDGWRIHFGTPKDDERFGGVILLTDTGPMTDYKIGQAIYVEGQPVDAGVNSVFRVSRMMDVAPEEVKMIPAEAVKQ